MDLQDFFLHLIEIFLQDPTAHMRTITRTTEDYMINAQISHSIEMTQDDLETNLSTTLMGTAETMETFLVLHRLEVINLTFLLSADLIISLRLVSHLTKKYSHKTITRCQPMWSASEQLMMPSMN